MDLLLMLRMASGPCNSLKEEIHVTHYWEEGQMEGAERPYLKIPSKLVLTDMYLQIIIILKRTLGL